jgi:SAM-dependent methyltransferase
VQRIPNEVIFLVLKVLKKLNPGDTYYENYLWHYNKRKESFFDIYHFSWAWAIENHPKRILEIGTRTGLSMCQLLSAYMDTTSIERIVSCDLFNDGFISPELVKLNLRHLYVPDSTIDKIEFMVGDSKQTVPTIQGQFDYILVDGSHDKADAIIDLENVYKLIAPGGVIVFDDITPDRMDLLDVWHDFRSRHENEFTWNEDLNGKGLGWAIKK